MESVGLRKIPVGIQDFEKLRRGGFAYIDKTDQVYQLVSRGSYYFLSRPRRFGKSLLISTLKAFFLGKKDLFDDLAISAKADIDWQTYPVFHLDLNAEKYDSPESLDVQLNVFLSNAEKLYGKDEAETTFSTRFMGVIKRAYEQSGKGVVILVDEYDKPMLQAIGNYNLQESYRATLKGFYGALKSMDSCIKFAFITGVTKFGKVSVFSDLNHLNDISMDERYHSICGITEDELTNFFKAEINSLAKSYGISVYECLAQLKDNYDGYHFTKSSSIGLYNPFSVLLTFDKNSFGDYWFETGTPSYLVDLLQKYDYKLEEMYQVEVDEHALNTTDAESTNPIPVIYQSGYLTIKAYDYEFKTYTLGFPNKEVEKGFTNYLMPRYIYPKDRQSSFNINHFVKDVRDGNTEQFITRLRSLFADTPYELVHNIENHYQNVLWLLYKLLGFYTQAEYHTSSGRIDLVVKSEKYCYVMEFKLDGTAEQAIKQIKDKAYTLPFKLEGQQIIRIGINFDSKTRNIDNYLYEND